MTCVASGCTNKHGKKVPGITFHYFPKNEQLRKSWIEAVKRDNWQPSKCSKLCSEHFDSSCFDRTSCLRVYLKEQSIPTIFKRLPKHLQKFKKMEEENNSSDSLEVIEMNVEESKKKEENVQVAGEADKGNSSDEEDTNYYTKEEAQKKVMERVSFLLNSPKDNPLLLAKIEIGEMKKNIQLKLEELDKAWKSMDLLYRCQVKFLQHQGLMAKPATRSVGVGINLPFLPETVSNILQKPGALGGAVNSTVRPSKLPAKQPPGPVECIDLTDDMDTTDSAISGSASNPSSSIAKLTKHPAPLPLQSREELADSLHIPQLKIEVKSKGIVLTWDLPKDRNVEVDGYDVFYYQEQPQLRITSSLWKKLVRVQPLPLPMSCLLSHLEAGYKYHFAVRASKDKPGPFSDIASAMFTNRV